MMAILFHQNALAQLNEIGSVITKGTEDPGKILSGYLSPYSNAFGSDLNAAWYNTAKPHKTLGFDLTLTLNAAFVPSSDKTFDLNGLGLTGSTGVAKVTAAIAPTVAGDKVDGRLITYLDPSTKSKLASFRTPQGTGIGVIPAPMMQIAIGVPLGSEIMFRFIPNTSLGDNGSIQLFGIGLKHSLKQWIPGISMAPFFNFSVVAGYTQLKTDVNLNFQPSDLASDIEVVNNSTKTYTDQNLEVVVKGFTGNLVASFDLPIVTFYAGLGFCTTNTNLKVNGTFPIADLSKTNQIEVADNNIINPVDTKMKSTSGSSTKPRLNGGVKFKLGFLTIHFDYTKANYSVVTAGLGISIR